jgi:DNA polymerase-3 subunit delta'
VIRKVQLTATVSARKVAIIYEADRMNTTTANVFLKTLEEPPANTTLLLLTTHPYALLPTLRSRCLHFRFPADPAAEILPHGEDWAAWRDDYCAWLGRVPDSASDKATVADHIFSIYGLVARFGLILEKAAAAAWAAQKDSLPPDLEDDEQTAIETGIALGLRDRLFAGIEEATGAFARPRLVRGDEAARRAFPAAIENLEIGVRRLRLNLNESVVLENFLLASLRLWSNR